MRGLRTLLFLLLIVGLQGALYRLLPSVVSPPDLFLLTAVALAWRLRPVPALLAAYAVGLLQDVLGHGLIGFHAAGAAGGVLLLLGVQRFIQGGGAFQTLLAVVTATAGQWLAFLILTYWLRSGLVTVSSLATVLPVSLVGTLLLAGLVDRLAGWAVGPRLNPEEGLA